MTVGGYSFAQSGMSFIENWNGLFNEFSKENVNFFNVLHYCSGIISDTAGIVYGANAVAGGFTAMFGKCFVAGTKIKTEDGDKNIEDIEVGDRVYSYNPETGEEGYKTVKRTFIKESDEIVHVTISNSDKSESVTIDATPGHPFYVVGYGFKYASELKIGDKLRSVSGDIYEVTDTEVEHFGIPIKVYNFEVEDWHTYAVSEVGVVVHNSKGYVESGNEAKKDSKSKNTKKSKDQKYGSYEITFKSGKKYIGKGSEKRMNVSANYRSKLYDDEVVSKVWEPALSNEDAFIAEYLKLLENGGPKSPTNYNAIESPGKKYYEKRLKLLEED